MLHDEMIGNFKRKTLSFLRCMTGSSVVIRPRAAGRGGRPTSTCILQHIFHLDHASSQRMPYIFDGREYVYQYVRSLSGNKKLTLCVRTIDIMIKIHVLMAS